jgi:hypothetical protein
MRTWLQWHASLDHLIAVLVVLLLILLLLLLLPGAC